MNAKLLKLSLIPAFFMILAALHQVQSAVAEQPNPHVHANFTAFLNPGMWTRVVIGPTALEGGYVVDISPAYPSADGASIQYKIIPAFDGEQWNDVLCMFLPSGVEPLKVRVNLLSTVDWPVVFQSTLDLIPGELQGYLLQDASVRAGYVVEVDPLDLGNPGDTFENLFVQPEFPGDWFDVLRIQIPASQAPLRVNVKVYMTTADLPVQAEFTVHLEPGVWNGFVMGESKQRTGYVMEVTPLYDQDNQILTYRVQPEFNGADWLDVARLMIPADRPATDVVVTIYDVW
jgi:hypothetical protein